MKLEVYGAAHEVGRSAFILDTGKDRILLDYGVKIEPDRVEYPLEFHGMIDAMILSHAHLDHSGYVPHLFTQLTTTLYMTPPTLELSELLWEDAMKVAKLRGEDPPYGREHIKEAKRRTVTFHYYQPFVVGDISVEFSDAGHIPGSALTRLDTGDVTILYTGDFKIEPMRLHSGADLSHADGDILIIESTYANRDHPPREETERRFVEKIKEILDNGGHVVIPVFALGRAQEIIDLLTSYHLNYPIYFDGMARQATRIILRFPDYISNYHRLKKASKKVIWIRSSGQRDHALDEPSIIVATAGMLQGGPVLHYLLKLKDDPSSAVLFTGYQTKESPGRKLLEEGKLEIDNYVFDTKIMREYFDFSAHAGREDLFKMIEKVQPDVVIAIHGDPENVELLAREVEERYGIRGIAPNMGDVIEL